MNVAKVDSNLQSQMNIMAPQDGIPVIVYHQGDIHFKQAIDDDTQSFSLINAQAMKIRPADVVTLSRQDDIVYIWPDLPVYTCLDVSVAHIQTSGVWGAGFQGNGIKLAIVDTGIDPNHPDFSGRIVAQKSFVSGSNDDNGHGTHVTSIAAGSGAKSNGKYRGVAPGAGLYIAKVLDSNGSGSMSGVMAGIEWAVDQGAQVINLSLGSSISCDGTDALSTLCDAAVEQGVVMCVAAGNAGPGSSTVGSPGCAKLVITVGATNDQDQVTGFSSRGPTTDGRVKPDIVFPGFGIVAAQATGTQLGDVIAPGYISLNGTSMAAPHASGAACLLLQAKSNLIPAQIKSAFQNTAVDLNLPANTQGTGRGNVLAAYRQSIGQPPSPEPTPTPIPTPTPPPGNNKGCLPESLAKLFERK